jgi:hypothetical protein
VSGPVSARNIEERMKIYDDPYTIADWDQENASRCFVTIIDSAAWTELTGEAMPTPPVEAADYATTGLPWFDYQSPSPALGGSATLAAVKSVGDAWSDAVEDLKKSVPADRVIRLGRRRVREMRH